MPSSAQCHMILLFCPIPSFTPLTSFSPGGRSWGVRQLSRQAHPSSSWDGLQDVLLAWTKKKKKKAFVSWKNSTSILKLYLLGALGHAVPSGLWLHSFQEGEGRRLQGWAAGCLLLSSLRAEDWGVLWPVGPNAFPHLSALPALTWGPGLIAFPAPFLPPFLPFSSQQPKQSSSLSVKSGRLRPLLKTPQ